MAVERKKNQNIKDSSFQDSQTQMSQAQRDSVQNQNSGNQFIQFIQPPPLLPRWARSSLLMYCLAGLLAVIGILITWSLEPINSIIGIFILLISLYLSTGQKL